MRRISRLLALAGLVLGLTLSRSPAGSTADLHAGAGINLSFSPYDGLASTYRLVQFSGFLSNEVLDLAFTAPDGTAATVGGRSIAHASAEDDGTGAFPFTPTDWLSPMEYGQWTVTVTGETSGQSTTATFEIDRAEG